MTRLIDVKAALRTMARVYLPDIENAEVESYNHAD